ncbi:MAG: hypothetical protein Fur0022_11280 [Anaerolineales bacterium]
MRHIKKFPVLMLIWGIFIAIGSVSVYSSQAETTSISIGPWTFEEADFADTATVLDTAKKIRIDAIDNCTGTEIELGTARFEECVNLALTGYTPEVFLVNTGSDADTESNWFQLDFTDEIKAENHFGPDLVFFECHYDDFNSYEFAVRPEGGEFTDFITYPASAFEETDNLCSDPFTNWGLELDLSDFGLPSGTIVDSIQFKVADPDPFDEDPPQGEPSMVAVLTTPITTPTIYLPLIVRQ